MSQPIRWQHDGRRIILPVRVLTPSAEGDLEVEGYALLDTGSTLTGIPARVARKLGLVPRGKKPIGSITGDGQAERYYFRIALHGPPSNPTYPLVFDDRAGFELRDSFAFEALIGMDILGRCNFAIGADGDCSLSL